MKFFLKRILMILAGLFFLGFAMVLVWFLYQYLSGGSGLQFFSFIVPISSVTVLVGLFHVLGFCLLTGASAFLGIGLCARGFAAQLKTGP